MKDIRKKLALDEEDKRVISYTFLAVVGVTLAMLWLAALGAGILVMFDAIRGIA